MKKYTMDDFINKNIAVLVGKKNVDEFLKMCELRKLKWNDGKNACGFKPPLSDDLCIEFGAFGIKTLCYASKERAIGSGFEVVDFRNITDKPSNCYQIIIDCDGDTTMARMIVNGKEVKRSQAKRNPADKFNVRIGAQFAFDRLWKEQKAEKPEKKAKKEPGVFCVGDRVVCTGEQDGFKKMIGERGRVVNVRKILGERCIGVEFERSDIFLHSCMGAAKRCHGWWFEAANLRHE